MPKPRTRNSAFVFVLAKAEFLRLLDDRLEENHLAVCDHQRTQLRYLNFLAKENLLLRFQKQEPAELSLIKLL